MLKQFASWFLRDGYLQNLVGLLLGIAFIGWVLVPLLNIISAYVLFGMIFLVIAILTWRTIRPTTIGLWRKATTVILLSASVTFILYGLTLVVKGTEGSWWWIILGVGIFAPLILLAKLFPLREASRQQS